MFGVSRIR